MCGILGEFSFNSSLIEKYDFLKLLELSYNRGPDNQGYYSNNINLQFGFNRLSILDVSHLANQPIHSNDGRYTMVYNGEIYNYKDIRKILEKNRVGIKSTGDTEVLINAFSLFGIEKTIKMLDGMYAIGLFDKKDNTLSLIRDFAGIKPLHYGINNNRVIFSSQYNQISNHPSFINIEIDLEVLKLYLAQHFIPAPFGLLKNSFQVEPGEIIQFDIYGKYRKSRYWELPKYVEPLIFDKNEAQELIKTELSDAVKSEMISDMPLGALLSSGIDSTMICYYAKKNMNGILHTITIGNDSIRHDESEFVKENIENLGIGGRVEKIDANIVSSIFSDLSSSMTEPFADFSIIPTFFASKIAKKDISVALTGDGGDELFFGYERFWSIAKNIGMHEYPYPIKYLIYLFDKIFYQNSNLNGAGLYRYQNEAHFNMHSRFKSDAIHRIFPYLKGIHYPSNYNNYDYPNTKNEFELIQYMRHAEFYGMMQKTLRKVDQASMANSLELRVPFLKKSFIEATLKIDPYLSYGPNKKKVSGKKILLKELLKKEVPSVQFDGIKRGFSIPLSAWLKTELFKPINDTIMHSSNIDYFDIEVNEMEKIFDSHLNDDIDNKWPIFTIYSLFNWRSNQSV